MKKVIFVSIVSLAAACTSLETSLNAVPVPKNRMFESGDRDERKSVQLTIIRDRSIAGSLCYYAIYIDDKLVSRIGSSEKATFSLEPGERKIQVTRDKQGEGLCSSGDDEATMNIAFGPNERKFYRLSQSMAGSPNLKVLDVPSELISQ